MTDKEGSSYIIAFVIATIITLVSCLDANYNLTINFIVIPYFNVFINIIIFGYSFYSIARYLNRNKDNTNQK